MSVLFLAGPRFNLLETATSTTASPAADSLFPTTNLYDRIPASIFKFGSSTANPTITVDLDLMGDTGGFESWSGGAPVGWTESSSGTGDVTQEAVVVHSGTSAARFAAGDSAARIYKDFTVIPGGRYVFSASLRGDGGVGAMRVLVQNLQTGNYWTGSVWTATPTVWLSRTTGSYSTGSGGLFVVESYAICRSATATLRVTFENITTTSVTYADSALLRPQHSFVSIHGHNIDPSMVVTVRCSSDNFVADDNLCATMTVLQPSCYVTYSALNSLRYVRLLFTGTQSTVSGPIWIGELVVGYHLTLATGTRLPMTSGYRATQMRVPMRWGSQVYNLGQSEQRTANLNFRATSLANRQEIFDEVFRRSIQGSPVVVVPHDSNSHTDVIYGRLATELNHEWEKHDIANFSTVVEELPFPFVTG